MVQSGAGAKTETYYVTKRNVYGTIWGMSTNEATRGRPRRAEVDTRIVDAALVEMRTKGLTNLTLEAVAVRAEVGRPTVYRRYRNKEELIRFVLTEKVPSLSTNKTEDPVDDLISMAVTFAEDLDKSGLLSVVVAAHAEARHNLVMAEVLKTDYLLPRNDSVVDFINRALGSNDLIDVEPETVRDLLFGPLIYRLLVVGDDVSPRSLRMLAETAMSGLRAHRST